MIGSETIEKSRTVRRRRSPRRRWLRRVAVALVALPVLLVVFRNEIVRQLAPAIIGPALGVELSLEAVSISLTGAIEIHGLKASNPLDSSPLRELRCELARIELSLGELASGVDAIAAITLSAPELVIDLDRVSRGKEPKPRQRKKRFPWPRSMPRTTIDVGSVTLLQGNDWLHLGPVEVRARPKTADTENSAARCKLVANWQLRERRGAAPLAISFDYRSGRFSSVIVTSSASRLVESATIDVSDPERPSAEIAFRLAGGRGRASLSMPRLNRAEVSTDIEGVALKELEQIASWFFDPGVRATGQLRLVGTAVVPLDDPRSGSATLDLTLEGACFDSVSVDRVELGVSYDNGEVRVRDLVGSAAAVEISSRGITANVSRPDPTAILASAAGAVYVRTPDLATTIAAFDVGDELLSALTGTGVEARISIAGRRISVAPLVLDSPCLKAFAEVSCDFDVDDPSASVIVLDGDFAVTDLDVLSHFLSLDDTYIGGEVRGRVAASGPIRDPVADVSVTGDGITIFGVVLDSLALRSSVLGPSVLIDELRLAGTDPPISLLLSGAYELGTQTLRGVTIDASASRLRSALKGLPAHFAPYVPEGNVDIKGRIEDRVRWPDADIHVRAKGIAGDGFRSAELFVSKSGDTVNVSSAIAAQSGDGLTVTLGGTVDERLQSVDLTVSRFELTCGGQFWELSSESRIRFNRSAPSLWIDPPLCLASSSNSISVELAEEATPDGAAWTVACIEGDIPERFDLEPWAPIAVRARSLRAETRFRGTRFPTAGFDVESSALRISLGELEITSTRYQPAALVRDLDITADLRASAQRPPDATLALGVGAFELRSLSARPDAEPLRGSLSLAANWDGRRVEVTEGEGTIGQLSLSVKGQAGLEASSSVALDALPVLGDVDFIVNGAADDLTVFRDLVPGLRRLAGSLHFAGSVRGDPRDPDLGLDVTFRNGAVRAGDAPELASTDADIVLTGRRIEVKSLTGELGGAPLRVTGSVSELWEKSVVDLALDGKNVLLVRDGNMRLRADTALRVSGAATRLHVGGRVAITDGRLFQSVPLVTLLGSLTRQVQGVATGSAARSTGAAAQQSTGFHLFSLRDPLSAMTFDVEVTAKSPIEVRGNVIAGKVRPQVTLRGTGETPFVVGVIYLDDFLITLPASRVLVESGSLRFDERNPLFPTINLTGSTRIRGYDITVVVTGTVAEPTVTFSSSPALPADKLVILVTTGSAPEGDTASDDKALFTVAKYFGVDLLRKIWGHDIDASESVIDRFELDVGRNVSRRGQETWEARFHIARDLLDARDTLYITGERDEFDHYNAGLRIVFRGR